MVQKAAPGYSLDAFRTSEVMGGFILNLGARTRDAPPLFTNQNRGGVLRASAYPKPRGRPITSFPGRLQSPRPQRLDPLPSMESHPNRDFT